MGLFEGVKNQLRSVIEWNETNPDILLRLFSERGDEIKNASKLIIKPGQGAIFVYKGKIEATHSEPGIYDIATSNIPFLTTISRFMQAFESEHKVGIYFYQTGIITNQKWGTKSPIKYIDPVYQFPIGMRSYGNFSFQIESIENLFSTYLNAQSTASITGVKDILVDRIISPLTDVFATAGYGYSDIDSNRLELSQKAQVTIQSEFGIFGLGLRDFRIENTDFDDETQARIKMIADTQAQTIAAKNAGISYADMQKLSALKDAANNESGAGLLIGMQAGNILGGMMNIGAPAATEANTEIRTETSLESRLTKLKNLKDQGLIDDLEYSQKKAEILSSI